MSDHHHDDRPQVDVEEYKRLKASYEKRKAAARSHRAKRRDQGDKKFSLYVPSAIYGDFAQQAKTLKARLLKEASKGQP